MPESNRVAGYVLTLNEECHVARAVQSLQAVCDRVLVIDSQSSDATVEIAKGLGADVVTHPFAGFSAQRNFALEHMIATYTPEYVLTIDADEWLSDELIVDVRARAEAGALDRDVYLLHRRICFDGRDLRWGGFANTWLPRLFRPSAGCYENRTVNEHLELRPGATIGRIKGDLVNSDVMSWEDHIAKHNRYSTLEAEARVRIRNGESSRTRWQEALRRPYLRRRWLRQHIWDRLPGRPALRFLQIYLFAGGVLDGRPGFRRALFEAWQEMCTDLKAEAIERQSPSPRP